MSRQFIHEISNVAMIIHGRLLQMQRLVSGEDGDELDRSPASVLKKVEGALESVERLEELTRTEKARVQALEP